MAQNDSARGNTRLGIFTTGIKVHHHVTIKHNRHLIQNDIQITHLGSLSAWSCTMDFFLNVLMLRFQKFRHHGGHV